MAQTNSSDGATVGSSSKSKSKNNKKKAKALAKDASLTNESTSTPFSAASFFQYVNDADEDQSLNKSCPQGSLNGNRKAKGSSKGKKGAGPPQASKIRDDIWSQSEEDEKRRMREFWLTLRDDQRRKLLQLDRDAVVRHMKDQHRQSCSCTVCGCKRTAMEKELDALNERYFRELESPDSMALQHQPDSNTSLQPRSLSTSATISPGSSITSSMIQASSGDFDLYQCLAIKEGSLTVVEELFHNSGRGFLDLLDVVAELTNMEIRQAYQYSNDEDEDEDGDDLLEDDVDSGLHDMDDNGRYYDDEDYTSKDIQPLKSNYRHRDYNMSSRSQGHHHHNTSSHFSHSLGGIPSTATPNHINFPQHTTCREHDHPVEQDSEDYLPKPLLDEGEDDIDEDEYAPATDRMDEGRRMFYIFAAKLFEQRIMAAYREQNAYLKQQKLIQEMEAEARRKEEDLRKKKEKREKKKQQKMKADEEKEKKLKEKQQREEEERVRLQREKEAKLEEERQRRIIEEQRRKEKEEQERLLREEAQRKKQEEKLKKHQEKKAKKQLEKAAKQEKAAAEKISTGSVDASIDPSESETPPLPMTPATPKAQETNQKSLSTSSDQGNDQGSKKQDKVAPNPSVATKTSKLVDAKPTPTVTKIEAPKPATNQTKTASSTFQVDQSPNTTPSRGSSKSDSSSDSTVSTAGTSIPTSAKQKGKAQVGSNATLPITPLNATGVSRKDKQSLKQTEPGSEISKGTKEQQAADPLPSNSVHAAQSKHTSLLPTAPSQTSILSSPIDQVSTEMKGNESRIPKNVPMPTGLSSGAEAAMRSKATSGGKSLEPNTILPVSSTPLSYWNQGSLMAAPTDFPAPFIKPGMDGSLTGLPPTPNRSLISTPGSSRAANSNAGPSGPVIPSYANAARGLTMSPSVPHQPPTIIPASQPPPQPLLNPPTSIVAPVGDRPELSSQQVPPTAHPHTNQPPLLAKPADPMRGLTRPVVNHAYTPEEDADIQDLLNSVMRPEDILYDHTSDDTVAASQTYTMGAGSVGSYGFVRGNIGPGGGKSMGSLSGHGGNMNGSAAGLGSRQVTSSPHNLDPSAMTNLYTAMVGGSGNQAPTPGIVETPLVGQPTAFANAQHGGHSMYAQSLHQSTGYMRGMSPSPSPLFNGVNSLPHSHLNSAIHGPSSLQSPPGMNAGQGQTGSLFSHQQSSAGTWHFNAAPNHLANQDGATGLSSQTQGFGSQVYDQRVYAQMNPLFQDPALVGWKQEPNHHPQSLWHALGANNPMLSGIPPLASQPSLSSANLNANQRSSWTGQNLHTPGHMSGYANPALSAPGTSVIHPAAASQGPQIPNYSAQSSTATMDTSTPQFNIWGNLGGLSH